MPSSPKENSLGSSKANFLGREESLKDALLSKACAKNEFLKTDEQYDKLRSAVSKAARQYASKLEKGIKAEKRSSRGASKRSLMNTIAENGTRKILLNNFVSLQ